MPDISVHRARSSAWKDALTGVWRRKRYETRAAANTGQRTSDNPSARRGGWFINRLVCAVRGHRDLVPSGTAKVRPNGVRRELYVCQACDSYAWKTTSNSHRFSWNDLGV
jgi:hypothetical protein